MGRLTSVLNMRCMLYAEAQGAFNGLIEKLKFELTRDSEPTFFAHYTEALNSAVAKRESFAKFVIDAVSENIDGPLPFNINIDLNVTDVIKTIMIASEPQMEMTRNQIDALRWPPFEEIASRTR